VKETPFFPNCGGTAHTRDRNTGRDASASQSTHLDGYKRATAGLLVEFVRENEELESPGDLLTHVDDQSRRLSTVVVKEVETVPLIEVPWSFAQAEGEGDESLEEWREGHRRFWVDAGEAIDDHTPVVLIWFEVMAS